jgi:hypothetical protein
VTAVKPKRAPQPKKRVKRDYSKQADKLCGAIVRARGACEAEGEHSGPLQWCHGFPRTYRAVRWDLRNGFCLCKKHHFFYTNRPEEWRLWMLNRMGAMGYEEVRAKALAMAKVDMPALVASLKEQAKAVA